MYGGELKRVRFEYSGPSIEAVLDRLPTAIVKEVREGVFDVTAEVYGEGVEMWMGSQKGWIRKK